jgi:SPP1 gp7 family putative phage head morphogenesis protein
MNKQVLSLVINNKEFIQNLSSLVYKELLGEKTEDQYESELIYWRSFVARAEKWERKFRAILRSEFNHQREEILELLVNALPATKAVQKISPFDIWGFDRKEWDKRLNEEGEAFIHELVDDEGARVMSDLRATLGPSFQIRFDVENPNVKNFLEEYKFHFAKPINDTTEKNLRRELEEGMGAGEDIAKMSRRVNGVFNFASEHRAEMIARTEVIKSSNRAAIEGYEQSGVVSFKQWLTVGDERMCGRCAELNGKRIKLRENFVESKS